MARARNLKPSFFTNDKLAEISALGRLLFAGLWTIADREGRLEDRPKRIKAELLPYDDCDVGAILDDLQTHGFILRYLANNAAYIQVLAFAKHQNPHVKETASTIPAPDKPCASAGVSGVDPADSLLPITSNGLPIKPTREQANAQPEPKTLPLPGTLRPETWAAWRTHLACKGKGLTMPTERLQLVRLAEHPDPDKTVQDAIAAGHASLPPPGGWPSQQARQTHLDARAKVAAEIWKGHDDGKRGNDITGESERIT